VNLPSHPMFTLYVCPTLYKANIPAATNPAPAPTALTDCIQLAALEEALAAALDALEATALVAVPEAVLLELPLEEALLLLLLPSVAVLQMSALTLMALAASVVSQALSKQGPTEAVIALLPVVHWHL